MNIRGVEPPRYPGAFNSRPGNSLAELRERCRQPKDRHDLSVVDVIALHAHSNRQPLFQSLAWSPRTKSESPGWRSRRSRSAARIDVTSAKA
jgi:hypothetical protein